MEIIDIEAKRQEAAARLGRLRTQGGEAVLAGKRADARTLVEAEAELSLYAEAEAQQVRQQREEAQHELAAIRQRLGTELADKEQARLACIGRAEKAARELAAALGDVLKVAAAERTVIERMDCAAPSSLNLFTIISRISQMLAAVLSTISSDHVHRFGGIVWHGGGRSPDTDWTATEKQAVVMDLHNIINNPENEQWQAPQQ